MRATAFGTEVGGYRSCVSRFHQVVQLQTLDALGVELAGGVIQTGVFQTLADHLQLLKPFRHRVTFTEYREVVLHAFLQRFTDNHRIFAVTVVVPAVETFQRGLNVRLAGVTQRALLGDGLLQMQTGRTSEDHQVKQRVAAQTVSAVYGYAGDLTHREQARNHHVFALLVHSQRLTGHFGRDTAHHVVTGWDNRDRLFNRVNVRKGTGQFEDTRQTGFEYFFTQMVELQFRVRPPRAVAAATFTDFDHNRTRDHVTTGQVLRVRGIALHKALAMFIQQITAFTTAAFCHQHARARNAGRVELPHFHILHRNTGTQRHTHAVAGVDMSVSGGLVNTACAAGRQHGCARFEVDHFAGFDTQRGTPHYRAILVFHQIQRIPFRKNGGVVFQVLLVQRVQQRVTGTVSRCCGTRRLFAAEVFRLAAERTLIDTAIVKTGERQPHVLQFQNRFRAGFAHIFNRVLVADVVRSFYGIVHVPFPVIFMGITERHGDATLCGYGMGTGWEDFGEQRTGLAALGNLQRCAHTCAACANNNSIKFSDWQFHYTPHTTTNP